MANTSLNITFVLPNHISGLTSWPIKADFNISTKDSVREDGDISVESSVICSY